MIVTKRDHLEKIELAKPLQGFIDSIANTPETELGEILMQNLTWNRPRGDLFHWIPALNRFDDIMEKIVAKYHLDEKYVKPHQLENQDHRLLEAVLQFTAMLLKNCFSKFIYNSAERIYAVINCSSIKIRIASLRVCVLLGERCSKFVAPPHIRDMFLTLATSFPPPYQPVSSTKTSISDKSGKSTKKREKHQHSRHFSLLACLKPKCSYPESWKYLDFSYFNSSITTKKMKPPANAEKEPEEKKKPALMKTVVEGLEHFTLSEDTVKKLSLQQIYDRSIDTIPPENYFEFTLSSQIAKAFNNNSFESIQLRKELIIMKCLSICASVYMCSIPVTQSRVLEQEPYLLSYLADLIEPSNRVPPDVHFAAIKTLESFSMKKRWGGDLVRALGGSVNHGLLFQRSRQILKQIQDDTEASVDENANVHFFNMLANLVDTKSLTNVLAGAGLLDVMMHFLRVRSQYRWTCSGATHLITLLLQMSPDLVEEFIAKDGLNALISLVTFETKFALENPSYGGGAPKDTVVSYRFTYRQNNYLKSVLKLVLHLIQSDSGDRMRNLFDSPILSSLNLIMTNRQFFGNEILACALEIVSVIIHNEPTAFAILKEAMVVETFLGSFSQLPGKSGHLLMIIPEVIGAIALNTDGLNKILELGVIDQYLEIFKVREYGNELGKQDNAVTLGATFDELARHYPSLKPSILSSVSRVAKELPSVCSFETSHFFQSKDGSLYHDTSEEVVEKEEDQKALSTWEEGESSCLIDNFCIFLGALVENHSRWSDLMEYLHFEDLVPFIKLRDAPYDYVLSNGLFSLTGVLKFFDDEDRNYGMFKLFHEIGSTLGELHSFLYFGKDDVSFFEQFENFPNGDEAGGKIMSLLNTMDVLLFTLTDVYCTPNNLFVIRMLQLAQFFTSPSGIKIMQELVLFFKRLALEEVNIQIRTPQEGIKRTSYFTSLDFSPVQVVLGQTNEEKTKKTDFTSAKLKNTLQLRFHINRCHTWLGFAFAAFTRMTINKRQDLSAGPNIPKNGLRITSDFCNSILQCLHSVSSSNSMVRSTYLLVVTSFMNSLLSIKGGRVNEQIVTPMAICFMQNGSFSFIKDVCLLSWDKYLTFSIDQINEIKDLKYVQMNEVSVTLNLIKQILGIMSKIVNSGVYSPTSNTLRLYEGDLTGSNNFYHELNSSLAVQARLLNFGLLYELLHPSEGRNILKGGNEQSKIILPLVELLVSISKHIYSASIEDSCPVTNGKLYPLVWEDAWPTNARVDYLDSLGFEKIQAEEALLARSNDMTWLESDEVYEIPEKPIEWVKEVHSIVKAHPYTCRVPQAIEAQYSNFTTQDELNFLRTANECTFIDQWLLMTQICPESVYKVADLLNYVFSKSPYGSEMNFEATVLNTVLEFVYSFDLSSESNNRSLASMLHLLGLLLQDEKVFYNAQNSLEDFLGFLVEGIQPEYSSRSWFNKALFVFERILIDSELPVPERCEVETLSPYPSYSTAYVMDTQSRDRFFEMLLKIKDLTSIDTALSVCRLLVLYGKDFDSCQTILKSGILQTLITNSSNFTDSPRLKSYNSCVILLVRRCFESSAVLNDVIGFEIDESFKPRRKEYNRDRSRDLAGMLKENYALVLRYEDGVVNNIASVARLDNCKLPLQNHYVKRIESDKQEDVSMAEGDPPAAQASGLVHLLLSEVMKITTGLNVFASKETDNKEGEEKSDQEQPAFTYLCFLLQALVELLCSYKQSKLEFLAYSKKQQFDMKPRSTSLNFLVHQLVPVTFQQTESPEYARRCTVSKLAQMCVFGFISSIVSKGPAAKVADPDLTFMRKFTVDILCRAITETLSSKEVANARYSKLFNLIELCGRLIGKRRDLCGSCLDKHVVENDCVQMTKCALEKNFPALLTGVLSDVDLNFPRASRVTKEILKALNTIGVVKLTNQESFKEAHDCADEDDLDTEEPELREETPDLFRNSTLGMYDVNEIDSEDDEYDYDDDPVDIVYSGDEDHEDEEELDESDMGLEEMEADANMPDFESEDDVVEEDDDELTNPDSLMEEEEEDSEMDDPEEGSSAYSSDSQFSFVDLDDEDEDDISVGNDDESVLDRWLEEYQDEGEDSSDHNSEVDEEEDFQGFEHHHAHGAESIEEEGDDDASVIDEMEDLTSRSGDRNRPAFFAPIGNTEGRSQDNLSNPFLFPPVGRDSQARGNNPRIAMPPLLSDFLTSAGPLLEHASIHIESEGGRAHTNVRDFIRVLNGESLGEAQAEAASEANIPVKSTLQRWIETADMFYPSTGPRESGRVLTRIINLIIEPSLKLAEEQRKEKEKHQRELELQREEKLRKQKEEEEKRKAEREEQAAYETREPVIVHIGDREVDIAGTEIDPEFFEALPDEMREEVLTQHVRERRAEGSEGGAASREIDPEFLDALPDSIREEVLAQEEMASHFSRFLPTGQDDEYESDREEQPQDVASETEQSKPEAKKRTFFSALVDKAGVASLLRLIFVPQTFSQRDFFHKTMEYLCYNKQTRGEILSLLLAVLQECVSDSKSLEKCFAQISSRAKATQSSELKESSQFPKGCTPLIVANQTVEAIQYLLETDTHVRYFFLTEKEPAPVLRKLSKNKNRTRDAFTKTDKFPLNILLSLLSKKLVKEETPLMELLSRTLQVSTRPLPSFVKAQEKKDDKAIELPSVPDHNLQQIVSILVADECSSKVFQQTLSAMQNLSCLPNAKKVFPVELSHKATALGQNLVGDLKALVIDIETQKGDEPSFEILSKFTPASADQAKLLRVLTALDYLFDSNQGPSLEMEKLTQLYQKLALGPLWGALSDCLKILRERSHLQHVATILSPLIEALMVVCKHSKVKELQIKDVVKYEEKQPDFEKEPIESLFFTFTDEHKKILNHMVRSNPKLMSGPFAMLVRNPKVLEFDNKKTYFDRKIHKESGRRPTMGISVSRGQVFLDSYRALFFKSTEEVKSSKLEISFKGEAGVDAGGVTREWFQVLSRQMFNPDYALFTPVASDKTTFHPNRTSWVNPEHLSFFKFIGRIIGKAVFDGFFLDCHFSRAVYKRILGRPVSLKDMETLDLEYFKSLMWMLENDITDIIVETFSVDIDDYGEQKITDLIPNGRNIEVTEENKKNYVKAIVEYRLQTSVQEQMDNFLIGFHEMIPKEVVAIFDEQELELLISGLPDIDVDDWKNHTVYQNYSASSPQIQWFWRAVKSFDTEERAKLLQFATGTSKVPLHGFKELTGVNGVSKFSIHRDYGSTERLPSSHTCFNQIDLPEYTSYEMLRGSLLMAITEGHEGFGLA